MIIWQGWGFLVIVILLFVGVGMELITENAASDSELYQQQNWPLLLTFLISAALVFVLNRFLDRNPGRVVIDKATGQEIVLKPAHALFFIPLKYWPIILVGLGVVIFIIRSVTATG